MIKPLIEYKIGAYYRTRSGISAVIDSEYDVPNLGATMLRGRIFLGNGTKSIEWLWTGHYRIAGHDWDLVEEVAERPNTLLQEIWQSILGAFGSSHPRLDQSFGEALAWEIHCHAKVAQGLSASNLEGLCKDPAVALEAFAKRSLELESTYSDLYQQAVSRRALKGLAQVKKRCVDELTQWRDNYADADDYNHSNNPLDSLHTKMWYESKIDVLETQILELEGLLESSAVSLDNAVAYATAARRLADDYMHEANEQLKKFREGLFTRDVTVAAALPLALALSETRVKAAAWGRLATDLEEALGLPS